VHLVYRRAQVEGLAPAAAEAVKRIDGVLRTIAEEAAQ
jgi:hypothetical protein